MQSLMRDSFVDCFCLRVTLEKPRAYLLFGLGCFSVLDGAKGPGVLFQRGTPWKVGISWGLAYVSQELESGKAAMECLHRQAFVRHHMGLVQQYNRNLPEDPGSDSRPQPLDAPTIGSPISFLNPEEVLQ